MDIAEWEAFLRKESQNAITAYLEEKSSNTLGLWQNTKLPQKIIDSGWLGCKGASEKELLATEERLGVNLPLSYRNFLKVTDGWKNWHLGILEFCSAEKITWFRQENQTWINTYLDSVVEWYTLKDGCRRNSAPDEEYFVYGDIQDEYSFRVEYLETALQISKEEEGEVVLLNPQIVHDGEWEAWFFSDHIGSYRYRSFAEMLQVKGLVKAWK